MKKISIILVFVMVALAGYGQRRMVTSAWNFLRDDFLKDAKEAIDKAAEHPDTKNDFRMHWYKGIIYHDLAVTEKPQYKNICDETCLDVALESYMNALRKNFVDPRNQDINFEDEYDIMRFYSLLQDHNTRYENSELVMNILVERFPALSNAYINRGVTSFQDKHDFEAALNDFEQALLISTLSGRLDTQLIYFASLAAFRAEDFEKTVEYNKVLIQMKFGESNEERIALYQSLAKAYELKEDYENMLKTLEEGIEKYPEYSYPLIIETFNHYVNTGQNEDAYRYISMAIEKNPKDPQFYVIKGALMEDIGQREGAIVEFKNALELDPDNFDANYSVGAYYYNTAVDTLQWADDNIEITNFAKHQKYRNIANEFFAKALPYLEKSHEIEVKNLDVLNTLRIVYYRLEELEKYEEVQKEINRLMGDRE